MTNSIIKIITDIDNFSDRVDEITATTSYDEVKHVISRLKKALKQNPDIPALCAPQIGNNLRLFVVKLNKSNDAAFKVFLNPLIVSSKGLHLSRETSPSIPDCEFIIPRKNEIHVAYQESDGHVNSETYIGAYGEVIQQMIEMLDGITLADYGLNLNDVGGAHKFNKAPKKQQAEVIQMYLQSLKEISMDLKTQIEESSELKLIDDTINFMTGLLDGSITPIKSPLDGKVDKEVKV